MNTKKKKTEDEGVLGRTPSSGDAHNRFRMLFKK
jgi:hypothetical protein